MKIICEKMLVFSEVYRMLDALYGSDPAYENTVIVLGYNVADYLPDQLRQEYPGKKLIVYQFEQLFDGSKWVNERMRRWLTGVDEIWEYDLSNMEWLTRHGFKPIYRPLCYCETLRDIPEANKTVDVLFYGFPTPRRIRIMASWMSVSWDRFYTSWLTGVNGKDLREAISHAKIVLNLHSFDRDCRQEQARIFYPVINGACVVSEKSPHNEFGKSIVECTTDKLNATLAYVLEHHKWKEVSDIAAETYKRHCEGRK